MTVESATYIDTLDPTLPLAGDPKSEGDNHLRLIKQVLQNTFPNVNAAVNATDEQLNALQGLSGRTNILINPHGSIQQETTTPITTAGYFADQWLGGFAATSAAFQTGVTTGTVSSYDPSHMFTKTTTAKGALAAGDFNFLEQRVEGNYIRRLLYGGSSAKGSWLRWRASSSQSGTASVAIRNGVSDRSFVQSFAVTTTPTDYFLFVPGDTTGTWPTDTTKAAAISFCHAAGTTFQTSTLGAWQAGNFLAANTQSNMLNTVNRQLNITDVQWSASNVLLPFEPVDYQQELARCMRYFQALTGDWPGLASSATTGEFSAPIFVPLRVVPTFTNVANGVYVDGIGAAVVTGASMSTPYANGPNRINFTSTGMTQARPTHIIGQAFNLNARM